MIASMALLATAHAACGDRSATIELLERQAVEGRLAEAEATSRTLVEAFGCGPLADREQLARLWLVEAVLASTRGESGASDEALAASARLSSDAWQPMFGGALEARLQAVRGLPPPEPGTLRVELRPGYVAAVDGVVVVDFPVALPPGPHLLQVGVDTTSARTALRFAQPPGFELVLRPDLPPLPAVSVLPTLPEPVPVVSDPPDPPRNRRILHALVVGAVSGLTYGASLATEAAWFHAPPERRSPELRTVTNGLVVGSAGMATVSAVLLVRGIATPTTGRGAP